MESKRSYEKEIVSVITELGKTYSVTGIGAVKLNDTAFPIFSLSIPGNRPGLPEIYLQAGIHGNEVASVYALLRFLKQGIEAYQDFFSFTVVPMVNPVGFEFDTRGNSEGFDLNRNFNSLKPCAEVRMLRSFLESQTVQYLGVLDLHEDVTGEPEVGHEDEQNPTAFYLYERIPSDGSDLAGFVVERLKTAGAEIWNGDIVYGEKCEKGIIRQLPTGPGTNEFGTFDECIQGRARYILIPETPTLWILDKRIDLQNLFIRVALDELKKKI
jgi:hypothetical protein